MYIAGIDEAGRGPIIGSMHMAIAVIDIDNIDKINDLKDSKLLTKNRRKKFYDELKNILKEYNVIKITAKEIDDLRKKYSLNIIEAKITAKLINNLNTKPSKIYIDCPDTNVNKYKELLKAYINYDVNLIVEHKADINYKIVSAASILAKVERDNEINELETKLGEKIGSGYPSDIYTINFLKKKIINDSKKEDYIRYSWNTINNIKQKKLL